MMRRPDAVAGLEIGSFKTIAVIAERYRNDQTHILGVGSAPTQGVFRGQVIDIEAAGHSIREAVSQAEMAAGVEVSRACVGIGGSHLVTVTGTAGILLRANERHFRSRHVRQLMSRLTDSATTSDREVIYINPESFVIDGTARTADPIGLAGRRLTLTAVMVTGTSGSLRNQADALKRTRLEIDFALLQPFAASSACLSEEQMNSGVAVLDIGQSTTDAMVFQGGSFKLLHSIPIAGAAVTADVSKGLHIPAAEAEEVKLSYGDITAPGANYHVQARTFDANSRKVEAEFLYEIIDARYEDILLRARRVLDDAGMLYHLAAGVVLTGGGAQMPGLERLAQSVFKGPVGIGRPPFLFGMDPRLRSPEYATAVGLALAGIGARRRDKAQVPGIPISGNSLESLRAWVSGFFRPSAGWSV